MPTRHVQVRLEEEEYERLLRHADTLGKSLQVCLRNIILDSIAEESRDVTVHMAEDERALVEGVLDMARHPSDKQDEFMMMLLQEIIKIRNNAKRTKKS